MKQFNIGDWVTSYTAGIWQVYRVVDDYFEISWDLESDKKKSDNPMIFSKRLCHNNGKRSFSTEVCSRAFVDLLDQDSLDNVQIILDDEKLNKAFSKYSPKPMNCASGMGFSLPDQFSYERFETIINELFEGKIEEGLTVQEINKALSETEIYEFRNTNPQNASIMIVCDDHEIVNSDLIFRKITCFNF